MIDEKDNIHEDDASTSSDSPRADQSLDQPVGDLDEQSQEVTATNQAAQEQLEELEQHNSDALQELERSNQKSLDDLNVTPVEEIEEELPSLQPQAEPELPSILQDLEGVQITKETNELPAVKPAAPQVTAKQEPVDDDFVFSEVSSKKLTAGLCAILLGAFGVHKFVLGYTNEGVMYIVAFIVSFFLAIISCGLLAFLPIIPSVLALIEGVIYLTKPEKEFYDMYIKNKKPWF